MARRGLLACTLLCPCVALCAGCRDRSAPIPGPAQPLAAGATAPAQPAKLDVAAWVRMRPSELGCWMERSFGYRDPDFGCAATPRPAVSDPCQDGFEDGPSVPAEVARRIHPLLRGVDLAWEHGALQSARFLFDPGVAEAELARILGVGRATLDTAASAGPGTCETPCYDLVVFAPSEVGCDREDEDGD